jgi:hypothetical protein
MSAFNDDNSGSIAAFASGAIVGIVATLLFFKLQNRRSCCPEQIDDDEYHVEGGDLFV